MEDISPVDFNACKVIEKLDGLIISATDWRVFKPYAHFKLTNLTGYIEAVFKSTFKGLDFGIEEPSRLLKVPIGVLDDFNVSVVACVNKDAFLDFKALGVEIRSIQLNIVDNKMHGTPTGAQGDWVHNERRIFSRDFHKFGNRLLVEMKNLFHRHCTNMYGVRLVFVKLGQDAPYWRVSGQLRHFNLKYVKQLVVHCAFDYKIDNVVLVWSHQDLNVMFDKKMNTKSFNVALLKGVGNFYYELNSYKKTRALDLVEVKCYSELFKNVHRSKPIPFAVPEIASCLFSPQEFALGFCKQKSLDWENKLSHLRAIRQKSVDFMTVGHSYSARCEVITSLTGTNVTMANITGIPLILKCHPNVSPSRISQCLRGISIRGMSRHMHLNLSPFVNKLMEQITRRLEGIKAEILPIVTPDEYLTMLAAEAIICFAVYGNAEYRRGRTMYPRWLLKALNIRSCDYRRDHDFEFPGWMFSEVVDQETLTFRPHRMHISDILQAVGEHSGVSESILQPIVNLGAFMVNYDQGVVSMNELRTHLKIVARVILECVKTSAIHFGRKSVIKGGRKGPIEFLNKTYGLSVLPRRFVTTLEFVENLFGQKEGLESYGFLNWIVCMVSLVLNNESLVLVLKSTMRNALEKELLLNNYIFHFPTCHKNVKLLDIVPLAGTQKIQFAKLQPAGQNNLCKNIQKYLHRNIVMKVMCQVMSEKWALDSTFQNAIDRMVTLMDDPRTDFW